MHGDCLDKMKELSDNSVDSIVTDPPYGLKFMSKKWDYSVPSVDIWKEALRVLKPGGHLLSFGGTRTYHRMVVNIEDAGFEIRDQIQWLYGSGFPKSHNISKGIDKKFGSEREVIGVAGKSGRQRSSMAGDFKGGEYLTTHPATDQGKQYDGYGTALKPANEPIVLARKPLSEKTIVDNVLRWGTGGINIDGCRVEAKPRKTGTKNPHSPSGKNTYGKDLRTNRQQLFDLKDQGRFPANLILDETAAAMLDEQSGVSKSQGNRSGEITKSKARSWKNTSKEGIARIDHNDKGGASRFFYCAKASKSERNEYLDDIENKHPTVKPKKLMEYLVKLITPEKGTVLDPFMGSGSTGLASLKEGFDFIGIDFDVDYFYVAKKRINSYE